MKRTLTIAVVVILVVTGIGYALYSFDLSGLARSMHGE